MHRLSAASLVLVLALVGCSSTPEPTPITLADTATAVPSALAPDAQTQPPGPTDIVPVNPATGSSEEEVRIGSGPADIGDDCGKYLQPVRDLLGRARSGTELTEAEARSIEERLAGAFAKCTPDEYVAFQMEMFPPSEFDPAE